MPLRPALVCCLLLAVSSAGAAEPCPPSGARLPERKMVLSVSSAPVQLRNERSLGEITAQADRGEVPRYGLPTNGLTSHRSHFEVKPQFWWVELGGGRRCIGIGQVDAHWAVDEIIVDIAVEYRPGSCQYQVVREHEEEHVVLTRRSFEAAVPRMRAALQAWTARFRPFVTSEEADAAADRINTSLMVAARPVLDEQERVRRDTNMAIDTPESYREVGRRCPAW